MKRIGLFGGSFDPVHLGHLLVARAALTELDLDRLVFIPAAQSPFKPDAQLASPESRLKMLRTALAGQPRFRVDERELGRGGISYTIDTAREYREMFPASQLFYLIGADHVQSLTGWRNAEELAGLLHFAVVPRPGQGEAEFPAPFRGTYLKGFPVEMSSTQVREEVKAGRNAGPLVPPGVAEIIRNNRLYLSA